MADRPVATRLLVAVWLGQLASLIGSSLTAFVLGVWVYQRTGSVTQFALIFLSATVPALLVAPFAGTSADRRDRRRLMLAADSVAAVGTVALAVLVAAGALEVWHIYLATALTAGASTVHQVAYQAMTPALVGEKHLARFNGLMQVSRAVQIAAPLIAGFLVVTVGVGGVLLIDLATFVVAAGSLLLLRLPATVTRPPAATGGAAKGGAAEGWRHLRGRPPLLHLMIVFGVYNFLFGIAGVLVQPLILSFATADTLGVLMFAGGAGLFAGSLLMGAWGGPQRRTRAVLGGLAGGGVALALHAVAPSPWLILVVAPLFLFTLPIVNSSTITLLQLKTEPGVLGRVMAAARVIGDAAVPVAYLLAGPLADVVFEPLLAPGGALAGTVGAVIGTGPGRGIALLFAVSGVAMVVLALVAARFSAVPRADDLPSGKDTHAGTVDAR